MDNKEICYIDVNLDNIERKADVEKALQLLSTRERDIIERRFGLNDRPKQLLKEIGEDYHLTRETIRAIEARAIRKLRHPRTRLVYCLRRDR